MNTENRSSSLIVAVAACMGAIAFGSVAYLAISASNKIASLPIEEFKTTAENSKEVSVQAKVLIDSNAEKIDQIVTKANTSLELITRQMERVEKINRFRGSTPEVGDDSYLDFAVRMREILDAQFEGRGYRVSLKRKTANKPQSNDDESETYEIWIAQRTGGTTSAQMAAGIINDPKTVLKKLTVSGVPRPGFDNRYVIWKPEAADQQIVNIEEGQTEADGPIFVLDWLALQDEEAKRYAPEIDEEQ